MLYLSGLRHEESLLVLPHYNSIHHKKVYKCIPQIDIGIQSLITIWTDTQLNSLPERAAPYAGSIDLTKADDLGVLGKKELVDR